jgi:hypothetical protein
VGGEADTSIVAEVERRGGGLMRSELGCGWEVGDPNLPENLDEGLDVVVVVGNTGEYRYSVSSTLNSLKNLTNC